MTNWPNHNSILCSDITQYGSIKETGEKALLTVSPFAVASNAAVGIGADRD
jgi:hypothetical protein